MKLSNIFGKTLRDDQKDADVISSNLMLRAGYVRQLAAGIYSYLHYGQKSLRKIEQILREEMDAIGGDEVCMPIVHPAEIWQKTNRWYEIDDSLVRFKDRNERDMVLAMTHEEIVAHLCTTEIDTYKQLPKLVYQVYTKFRDEPRSRSGLIRVREFTMKDSYSLDTSYEGLEKQYIAHYNAYHRIYTRTGLPAISILSDTGMMGGKVAHEYMYVTDIGEDTIFICEESGYKANKEVATIKKIYPEIEPKPLEKVHTPETKTITDVAEFLGVTAQDCAKMVFFSTKIEEETKVVVTVVRGDMEAHPIKIQKLGKFTNLEPATEAEIASIGSVAGYASPMDIDREKSIVIVDDLVANTNNLVIGANETDYHVINSCYGRDYKADIVGDIVSAYEGAFCPISEENYPLKTVRGVEIGNIFQLGTKYTEALGAVFMDKDGVPKPIIMGSYGIGVGRLLACLCEEYNDEKGLCLPISIAPYEVILTALLDNTEGLAEKAIELYEDLKADGVDILFDDRNKKLASPGVKFKDAELIGIPIQLTISKRSLKNGGLEAQIRSEGKKQIIPLENIKEFIQETRTKLYAELNDRVKNAETW